MGLAIFLNESQGCVLLSPIVFLLIFCQVFCSQTHETHTDAHISGLLTPHSPPPNVLPQDFSF